MAEHPFWVASRVKGWFSEEKGQLAHKAGIQAPRGPFVEIGAYCGKSTLYLGDAARVRNTQLISVDHHLGSPENQEGEASHDPELANPRTGQPDTLRSWRNAILWADLQDFVIGMIGKSEVVATYWNHEIALLLIDGAHEPDAVMKDYDNWGEFLMDGAFLLLDDVSPGFGPEQVYHRAIDDGMKPVAEAGSLKVLRT